MLGIRVDPIGAKFLKKPNSAFSGHGFAVGQRRWFEGRVASPAVLLDKHAVPLTLSLGDRLYFSKPEWRRHGYYLALCAF